jgi:hypothetical protein
MLYGKLILWKTENPSYGALVAGVDYSLIKSGLLPRQDGEPIDSLEPGYEWLVNHTPFDMPDYDSRVWVLLENEQPTNQPHPEYANYKSFVKTYGLEKRPVVEIIESVRAKEAEANASVMSEAESSKMIVLSQSAAYKTQQGIALSESEANAQTRMIEVSNKINRNAANAELLIGLINAGQEPDIDGGWEFDNITAIGFPFANINE